MPGKSKKGGGLMSSPVYKKTPFKMRSGNSPLFKQMGSSPLKQGVPSVQDRTETTKVKPYTLDKRWDRKQREKYFGRGYGVADWSDMNPIHNPNIKKRYKDREEGETLLDIFTK